MLIHVKTEQDGYDILIERGALAKAHEYLDLQRKCFIVTDDGVPASYVEAIVNQCKEAVLEMVPQGEASKSMKVLESLLSTMMEKGFTRGDCVIAVGGGMVGDLAGFAAACYMRGVDFYNIPTTVLSQADSSIGGKTAVNLGKVKNIVGAFHQPRFVLIDPNTLDTLPQRQYSAGLAELIKSGLIGNPSLFERFEETEDRADIEDLLAASLNVKRSIVEEDEKEHGVRKLLNLGHTLGHGIESVTGLLHGESVALGMIPMCGEKTAERLIKLLEHYNLPVSVDADEDAVVDAVLHDKKGKGDAITAVFADEPGKCRFVDIDEDEIRQRLQIILDRKG